MRRLFIDQLRRFDRTHVDSMETHDAEGFAFDGPGPADETETGLKARRLDRAWQRLDKDQRSLLTLHDIEGYTLAELMELTGLKEGTLKSRLHRARARLGKLLRRDEQSSATRTGAGGSA
jgi:RNA polymerase sigma-70 factor (ECF subfamily)